MMRNLADIERDVNNLRRVLNTGETFAQWVQSRRASERRLIKDAGDMVKTLRQVQVDA